MSAKFRMGEKLPGLVDQVVTSYNEDERTRHLDQVYLPGRADIIDIIHLLLELAYPGYHGRQNLNEYNVNFHVGELLPKLGEKLHEQVFRAICYKRRPECNEECIANQCEEDARRTTMEFLERVPGIRDMLAGDIQAAYDGDPAASSMDEIILAYPGVEAIMVHRVAHELWIREVAMIPRMMSEYIHGKTGIDIHPGARIGESFFIDHGTGVVIGETTEIGNNVKLYQGVTLGALSVKKEEANRKRHPTIEDDVTIYAGATILGGSTVIGRGSVIGGNVWLTESVPPNSRLYHNPSQVRQGRTDDPAAWDGGL